MATAASLPLAGGSIRAGFPSPAQDFAVERLDLMALLVKHPQATYFWRVAGDSMREAGIDDGDLITVDRALRPRHNNIVVALVDGDCTVKYLHQQAGLMKLRAANPNYPDILPRDGQTIEVWGVVTACIKRFASGH
jgi:DNA polymerase V